MEFEVGVGGFMIFLFDRDGDLGNENERKGGWGRVPIDFTTKRDFDIRPLLNSEKGCGVDL